MSWVAAAVVGGAVIGGVATSHAAGKAADAQTQAASQADATQRYMFDKSAEYTAPWRRVGNEALTELESRLGLGARPGSSPAPGAQAIAAPTREQFTRAAPPVVGSSSGGLWNATPAPGQVNPNAQFGIGMQTTPGAPGATTFDQAGYDAAMAKYTDSLKTVGSSSTGTPGATDPEFGSLARRFAMDDFETDPGYEFRLGEGSKALERSAAARGMLLSGGTLKGLTRYNQDFASNEYGNVYNRWNSDNDRLFNRFASVAGVGQTASSQVANNAVTTGNNIAQTQLQAGNARASGYVGQANAITGAVSQGVNGYMSMQYLDALKNKPVYSMGGTSYGQTSPNWTP